MIRPSRGRTLVLILVPMLLGGCRPSGTDAPPGASQRGGGDDPAPSAASEASAPTRAALPGLFAIMAGLQADMAGLDRALWREELDSVAVRATAVADHPTVPPAEAQTIAGVLGPDMGGFKEKDTAVHDRAVQIGELAGAGDLDGVLAARAELARGCVDCHTQFRERIREGLR